LCCRNGQVPDGCHVEKHDLKHLQWEVSKGQAILKYEIPLMTLSELPQTVKLVSVLEDRAKTLTERSICLESQLSTVNHQVGRVLQLKAILSDTSDDNIWHSYVNGNRISPTKASPKSQQPHLGEIVFAVGDYSVQQVGLVHIVEFHYFLFDILLVWTYIPVKHSFFLAIGSLPALYTKSRNIHYVATRIN
jgi:hypothetical protein